MAGGSYPRSGLASPTYAAQTLASLAQQPVMSADSICPPPLLERFVDDYFTFIHPLVPVPHEPSFRAALAAREDMNNPIFLALLASMIGYLVAAFPRRPKLHVHHLRMEGIFQNSDVLLDRCRRTAVEARGIGYLDRQQTMHDAIIAYFQGMIGAYHYNWDACRLYLGQCITISRVIGLYKQDGPGCAPAVNANGGEETVPQPGGDIVVRETSRRLFWTLYSTITSLQHLGLSARDLSIAHPTKPEPYPDLPVEVDDMYITPQGVRPMPQGRTSRLVGFNAIVKVYQACAEVSTMEMAYGLSEIFDSVAKGVIITRALDAARLALKNLPPELTYGSESSSTAQAQQEQSKYPPPTQGYPELHSGQMAMHIDNSNTERKEIQFEIQKLNIVATGIATRCILLEKYSQVSDNAQSSTETGRDPEDVMREERDEMTKDFLRMIRDLDLTYLEPAGLGFVRIPSPIPIVPSRYFVFETHIAFLSTWIMQKQHGANGSPVHNPRIEGSNLLLLHLFALYSAIFHVEIAGLPSYPPLPF